MLKAMNSSNEMMLDKAEQKPKTWVWWDINSCPVPDGYDASMVGQCIELALKKAGYSGPLTITAIGFLNRTLNRTPDVLPAIYSTGILLKHVHNDFRYVLFDMSSWARDNPAPATLMLISGADAYPNLIFRKFAELQRMGYTTLLAYPQQVYFPFDSREWLWETLLKDAMDSRETRRQCETVESAWLCSRCSVDRSFQVKSFEDFTTHLKSRDHALRELDMVTRPISSKLIKMEFNATIMVKKQNEKRSFEEVEEKGVVEEEEDKWDRITV